MDVFSLDTLERIEPESSIAILGKELFYSKILSGDKNVACITCPHPKLMGGDGLSLPIGMGEVDPNIIGSGRQYDLSQLAVDPKADGSPNVARNSPTTFNSSLYEKSMFWDGRIRKSGNGIITPESVVQNVIDPNAQGSLLASQSIFPLTSIHEMKGHYLSLIHI